ncbi:hypothetical protein CgunFtcFv8_003593 [Champsocephalus gunnari]|uniref:Uncharacterized protein n=1 Tax=Champsocephalus gunnari TaxID=52237 RepID=A0AAN8E582_CHAGU|nr:hypothetical protein CgunFtcFv8_003593 [Champsocephalus gunnari]
MDQLTLHLEGARPGHMVCVGHRGTQGRQLPSPATGRDRQQQPQPQPVTVAVAEVTVKDLTEVTLSS